MANLLLPLASGLAAGFFGAFLFALGKEWVWRQFTRPDLELADSATARFETDEDGEVERRVFRVPVENAGRSAATNCKPELRMEGSLDGRVYEVTRSLTWAEGDGPDRITVNTGERAAFDLFRVVADDPGGHVDVDPTLSVQFPGDDGWDDGVTVWEYEDDRAVDASVHDGIERGEFDRIDWETAEVRVTAENAGVERGGLRFELGDQRGMVGMEVGVDS